MSERFDLLALELFQKKMAACSLEEIRNLATHYPYFAPAQLLLAKKSKELAVPDGSGPVQRAALFYPDALLFDLLLNEEKYATSFVVEEAPEPVAAMPVPPVAETVVPQEKPFRFKLDMEAPEADLPVEEEEDTEELEEEALPALDIQVPAPAAAPQQPAVPSAANDDNLLTFEPFHTVDYFASQGIKLSQEETQAPKDTVGRQLKSFTEWLKTMKRLPAEQQGQGMDRASERKVESLAAHSVEASAILTEAMAEVWAKQGNREKAMEIYTKLSLLNPSKKAYFAAKVENLKKAH
ncbi:hypothetical protein V9K67_01085 [Paraflavisolibacter sp. H34]|uniref:hypothetical protein n=1 Tax=Huijunlia imazamoxiresistens TaxID=3127457 RepID=UPI0030197981